MGIFTFYFTICLFALLIRGYYRVPQSCIIRETISKEEDTYKSIIADRMECKCHYTISLWHKPFVDHTNQTMMNISMRINNIDDEHQFELLVLVRNTRIKK
jgi:hypothetical protein